MENALQLVEAKMLPEQVGVVAEYRGIDELARIPELLDRGQQIKIENESQVDEIKEAREIRLDLKRARVAVDNRRKKLKEDIVRRGKALDGVANILKDMIVPVETHLEDQERFAERLEEKRLAELAETRAAELAQYAVDTQFYDLRKMSEQGYAQLLDSSRIAHETKLAAEKKAAEEQAAREKAEAEEREKTRLENERLKAEAAERDKTDAAQAKAEAKRKAGENARLAAERQAKERAEAETREIREAQERKDREETKRQEAEERAQKEAGEKARRAPDKEKLLELAVTITGIEFPRVKSEAARETIINATAMLSKAVMYIKEQITKM